MLSPRIAVLAVALAAGSCARAASTPLDTVGVDVEVDRVRAVDTLDSPGADAGGSGAGKPVLAATTPPVGAAGFDLGIMDTEAERRCRAAGELWSAGGSAARPAASCSGSAGAPLPFKVDLRLCDGNVCRLVLSQHLTGVADPVARFHAVAAELLAKYGPASTSDAAVPDACAGPSALPACLQRGRAKLEASWVWDSGYTATARLSAPSGRAVFLLVAYGSPAFAKAERARGL